MMAIKSSGSSSKVPHIFGIFMDRLEKIKGAAAYVDPLGYIGNQLESFFTRQSYTFNDEPSSRVMKRITGQQLFSSMN